MWYVLIALAAGAAASVQLGVNGLMRGALGSPLLAAMVNNSVGLLGIVVLVTVTRTSLPTATAIASAPWFGWFAGLLGVIYIVSGAILVPKLGVATTFVLILVGQVAMALTLDVIGAFGAPSHPITMSRLLGAILVVVGAVLVFRR